MCDFAGDAEAASRLLVGRVLPVERGLQLNAKHYFYPMLKDNTGMLKVYPGILLAFAITEKEVRVRLQDNPAKLMWLA